MRITAPHESDGCPRAAQMKGEKPAERAKAPGWKSGGQAGFPAVVQISHRPAHLLQQSSSAEGPRVAAGP